MIPEAEFHRYFRLGGPASREAYPGRADFGESPNDEERFLLSIQRGINDSLEAARRQESNAGGEPFHFDYIDAADENALAFHYNGFRFIGLTLGFVRGHIALAQRIATSPEVLALLPLPEGASADVLLARLFGAQLGFVSLHEFAHHLFGHVPQEVAPYLDESGHDGVAGMDRQMHEVFVDGYAVDATLTQLIHGEQRGHAVVALNISNSPKATQDKILLELFAIALGGHFLSRSPRVADHTTIYDKSHPPPAARMHFALRHLELWSTRNHIEPGSILTNDRFQDLMHVVANVVWGPQGEDNWQAQVAYLKSTHGHEYMTRLGTALDAYKTALQQAR